MAVGRAAHPPALRPGVRARPTTSAGSAPTGTISSNNWNDYATTDATTRYLKTSAAGAPNGFCTGDNTANTAVAGDGDDRSACDSPPTRRTRSPPRPSPGCTRQYPGYTTSQVTAAQRLQQRRARAYKRGRWRRVFHQWATALLVHARRRPGDYYLQVRTNVALGGTVSDQRGGPGQLPAPGRDLSGFAMYTQAGRRHEPCAGGGSNRFSVRAFGATGRLACRSRRYGKMSIFANATRPRRRST